MTATSVQVPESLLVCVREAQLFTPSVGWFELQSCPELEGPSLRHSAEGKFFLAVLHDSLSALCFGKDGLLGSLRSQCFERGRLRTRCWRRQRDSGLGAQQGVQ